MDCKRNPEIMWLLALIDGGIRKQIDAACTDMTVARTHGWIIGYIASAGDEDVYQKDLEKELGLTRSTTSKTLGIMEERGLICREKVARDDRLKKLVLTERSKKLVQKIQQDNLAIEQKLTRGFSEEELIALKAMLVRMQENVCDSKQRTKPNDNN